MGFKENLKSELAYKDMTVKELAAKTGISRHTLDNYLNIREHTPTLDAAVKIAKALGVSVEYLATGEASSHHVINMNQENLALLQYFNLLNEHDRKIITEIEQLLLKHRSKK
jgi:transcriptional regulator with XRE-family HTH domain